MEPNLSLFDTILRVFIGAVIGGILGAMGWIIGIIAVYPIVTGLAGFDPVYHFYGYSTRTEHPEVSDKIDYNNTTAQGSPEPMPNYRQTA